MIYQQVYILNSIRMIVDALGVIFAGYGARYLSTYYIREIAWRMDENIFAVSILIVMFVTNYSLNRLGMYGEKRQPSALRLILPLTKAVLSAFGFLVSFIFVYNPPEYPRIFLYLFAALCLCFIFAGKVLIQIYVSLFMEKSFNARRILIVGDIKRGKLISDLLASQASLGHKLIGRLESSRQSADPASLGTINDLPKIVRTYAIDEVVFALEADRSIDLPKHLNFCRQTGIAARILPALWQPGKNGLNIDQLQGVPFFTIKMDNFNATGLLYKRFVDIIGGLIGTILFLIIYPFIGMAIKLDSPGPIIFKQKRVGQNGRIFKLYKFRTMYQDAEVRKLELLKQNEMQGFMFKLQNDPRITPVGRWLRKTSLDEFPQFLNVLKGEMSLVGTRPPTLDEVKLYQPWHLRRISAKPGLTGLWQISGRNKITDFEKVVELDCSYLDKWRFADDIRIILRTIPAVLKRKGAF